jgi:hypothetical protein
VVEFWFRAWIVVVVILLIASLIFIIEGLMNSNVNDVEVTQLRAMLVTVLIAVGVFFWVAT